MSESKNLQVRIPAELHQKLRLIAAITDTTVTDLVTRALQQVVDGKSLLFDSIGEYRHGEVTEVPEPAGEFCACSDPDCKGDHR